MPSDRVTTAESSIGCTQPWWWMNLEGGRGHEKEWQKGTQMQGQEGRQEVRVGPGSKENPQSWRESQQAGVGYRCLVRA